MAEDEEKVQQANKRYFRDVDSQEADSDQVRRGIPLYL